MNDSINVPGWFIIVAVLAVLWEAMGVMAFIQTITMTADDLFALSVAEQTLYNTTPDWANAAFAIAVFSGLIGALLLVFKKSIALPFLVLSLLAVLVQMYNAFFIMDSFAVFGPGGVIMPIMVIVIAILLIWLAHFAKSKQWIT